MDERKMIYLDDAIDAFEPDHSQDWYTPYIIEKLESLPSAQPEHPLLKIIQDFKEMTGCEDVLVVQKDAMKAWDENGVAYTMQPEQKKGEWLYSRTEMAGVGFFICSACGEDEYSATDFCPNCGADMRGDQDE